MNMVAHLIYSYPRSGNHLVRAVIEAASQRPTLGCPDSSKDLPIYLHEPNQTTNLIKINDETPIGAKAHTLLDAWRHQQQMDVAHLILITRDPVACISSHLARSSKNLNWFKRRKLNARVNYQINLYLSSISTFRSFPPDRRVHIKFDDIVDPNTGDENLKKIAAMFADNQKHLDQLDFAKLRNLAKDSQRSLPKKYFETKAEIGEMVAKLISYEQVLGYLAET